MQCEKGKERGCGLLQFSQELSYCRECATERFDKERQERERRVMRFYSHMLNNPRLSVMRDGAEFLVYQDARTLLVVVPVEMVYVLPPHELLPACRELYQRKQTGIPRSEREATVYIC